MTFKRDVLPVNKPYDIAERRPKMSPMMECFVLLDKITMIHFFLREKMQIEA